jgi:glycosyltransferase involved in cell wall biosynthesis
MKALSLIPRGISFRGYIIGGPIYQTLGSQLTFDELRFHAAALGLSDRLGFTGFVDDTASAIRALDVVVHASTAPEPFGMVIAEGMACGKPVIAARAGGAMEIFREGVDALGHIPGDPQSLARQVLRLVKKEKLREALGKYGRARTEVMFTRSRLGREFVKVYREVELHASARASMGAEQTRSGYI